MKRMSAPAEHKVTFVPATEDNIKRYKDKKPEAPDHVYHISSGLSKSTNTLVQIIPADLQVTQTDFAERLQETCCAFANDATINHDITVILPLAFFHAIRKLNQKKGAAPAPAASPGTVGMPFLSAFIEQYSQVKNLDEFEVITKKTGIKFGEVQKDLLQAALSKATLEFAKRALASQMENLQYQIIDLEKEAYDAEIEEEFQKLVKQQNEATSPAEQERLGRLADKAKSIVDRMAEIDALGDQQKLTLRLAGWQTDVAEKERLNKEAQVLQTQANIEKLLFHKALRQHLDQDEDTYAADLLQKLQKSLADMGPSTYRPSASQRKPSMPQSEAQASPTDEVLHKRLTNIENYLASGALDAYLPLRDA